MTDGLFGGVDCQPGLRAALACESTVRYVFGLIWPQACIDCSLGDDCYVVGVSNGVVRHIVKVPCALVAFDAGLTLVRAVYRSGIPGEMGCAESSLSLSL